MVSFGHHRQAQRITMDSAQRPKPRRRTACAVVALFALLLVVSFGSLRSRMTRLVCDFNGKCEAVQKIEVGQAHRSLPYHHASPHTQSTSLNSTFGFEKVYVINLSRRRDRMSVVQLLMMQYGIEYDVVEGVDGAVEKPTWDKTKQRMYGRTEGHAKVWQKIVADRVQSAVVIEDSFDMDVRIHEQMQRLQEPFAVLQHILHGRPTELTPHDGWNTHLWDMLWFGQCSESAWTGRQDVYVTYDDPTRSRLAHFQDLFNSYDVRANTSRIIQPAHGAQCTTAYAMTITGAARALYQNTHRTNLRGVDVDLLSLTQERRLRAFTVNPALFTFRTAKDGSTNDGDLVGDAEGHSVPVPGLFGTTNGIDRSAREQLIKDVLGDEPVVIRQKNSF